MENESSIREKLNFLLFYNTVRVTHSFKRENIPFLIVQCRNGTKIIEVINVKTNAAYEYDSVDEAIQAIQFWLKEE